MKPLQQFRKPKGGLPLTRKPQPQDPRPQPQDPRSRMSGQGMESVGLLGVCSLRAWTVMTNESRAHGFPSLATRKMAKLDGTKAKKAKPCSPPKPKP